MAPSATEVDSQTAIPSHPGKSGAVTNITEITQPDAALPQTPVETTGPGLETTSATSAKPWVESTGVLDKYEYFDVTPVIGREFKTGNLVEWLQSPNAGELLRELALTSRCF